MAGVWIVYEDFRAANDHFLNISYFMHVYSVTYNWDKTRNSLTDHEELVLLTSCMLLILRVLISSPIIKDGTKAPADYNL
jgi:hypothetical protein